MFRENHTILIESILSLRQLLQKYLPIDNSLIAYDLILLLSIHNYSEGHITVKQLFRSLPYSSTAIRYHYTRFITDGWIEIYRNVQDKRVKFVRPTQKFIEIMNAFTKDAERLIIKN